jgi:signal transduction histidine kinase
LTWLRRINSKILLKITFLVIIEIILIVGSFGVLAYFQSQQSSLGNSINIAGKNRYLTASLLLHTEKYLYGLSSDTSQLKVAINNLESNIITLKQGGMISGIDIKPLPSTFLDLWNAVDGRWNVFKTYVTNKLLTSPQARTTTDQSLTREVFESMASNLIESSDKLVTLLGQQTDKNSQNLILLQILFAILIIGILVLILYLVARMLRPIFALTQATSKVKKGNLDVSVKQKGNDELSVLSESFNSMIGSVRDYTKKQNDLTKQLEAANEELKYKDQLKDELINVAAHELRSPIQPILGLSEILRYGKRGGESNNSKLSKEDEQVLDIIIRNARRLLRLEQNILDMTRIESKTLHLDMETLDLDDIISNSIRDARYEIDNRRVDLEYNATKNNSTNRVLIEADRARLTQVLSNLLSNAAKFSKEGSIIVNTEKKGSEAFIGIRDTGPGIQPDIMTKLFSKFVTNSSRGTGLGLYISKSIIEAHGGKIWAKNNADGKGATFTFSMPISQMMNEGMGDNKIQ